MPKFRSWLGALNYYVLQWFFVRLVYIEDNDTHQIKGWYFKRQKPLTGWVYSDKVIKAESFNTRNGRFVDDKSLNDFKE